MLSQFHINTAQDKHPECVLMHCELWCSQTSVTLVKQKVGCLSKVNTPLPLCIPGTAYWVSYIFWPEDTFNLAYILFLISKAIYRMWMIDDFPLSNWTVTRAPSLAQALPELVKLQNVKSSCLFQVMSSYSIIESWLEDQIPIIIINGLSDMDIPSSLCLFLSCHNIYAATQEGQVALQLQDQTP